MVAKLTVLASTFAAILVACSSFTESDPTADPDASADAATTDAGVDDGPSDAPLDRVLPNAPYTGCMGDPSCVRTVFVTSATFTGAAIQSVDDADVFCTMAAANSTHANVYGRQFLAWLSTASQPASKRLVPSTMAYNLPDGTRVALDWMAFASTGHEASIHEDEHGSSLTDVNPEAWTGTNDDGSAASSDCGAWMTTSAIASGVEGLVQETGTFWSNAATAVCTTPLHLYCVER